jgi:hypothetical protein
MQRAIRALSLAIAFGVGAVVAIVGAFRGLNVGELALVSATTIVSLALLVRLVAGHYSGIVARRMAENRAARAARHLLDPQPLRGGGPSKAP